VLFAKRGEMSNFPSNALAFMECVGKLKVTKRTGWVRSGIQLPESIADHMYRMSMMSWMIADPSVNREKLMKSKERYREIIRFHFFLPSPPPLVVCMVHDLAESIVGDYTPHCKISREEKFVLEEVC
jgi:putative hydrolases of HD superfamily